MGRYTTVSILIDVIYPCHTFYISLENILYNIFITDIPATH